MARMLSEETATRLIHLLNKREQNERAQRGGSPRWAFVRCTDATAVGGNDVLDQCYPGIILRPACDYAVPPEEGFGALLTVLGDNGDAETPVEDQVYACLLTGEVESDRSGSGSGLINGRPRAFSVAGGSGGTAPATPSKSPVRVATTTNGTLSSAYENGDTIDGVTLATGDRILIKNQSSPAENGIYVVKSSGAPSRASDALTGADFVGAIVPVVEGTRNFGSIWNCATVSPITVGSTSIFFGNVNLIYGPQGTSSLSSSGTTVIGFPSLTIPEPGFYEVTLQLYFSVATATTTMSANLVGTGMTITGMNNCNATASPGGQANMSLRVYVSVSSSFTITAAAQLFGIFPASPGSILGNSDISCVKIR